jgi:hypothetical protein
MVPSAAAPKTMFLILKIPSVNRNYFSLTLSPLAKLNASCFLNVSSEAHLAQISSSVLAKSRVGGRLAIDDDDDVIFMSCVCNTFEIHNTNMTKKISTTKFSC